MKGIVALILLALTAAGLLGGCASRETPAGADASGASPRPSVAPHPRSDDLPAAEAVISYRDGPSWSGELGDTVQIDWYDQTSNTTVRERIAVLAVKRFRSPSDDDGPSEWGDDSGPYEWKYGIRVQLTSLDEAAARTPTAYQFLKLSDGRHLEDGVAGLGAGRGPDPSRVGRSSAGWLYQWADEGFTPTEIVLPIGAWRARWSLD